MKKIKVLISICIMAITGASLLPGCLSGSSVDTSTENTDIAGDSNTFEGVISRETWKQHPEWISRNYDLQGRPKLVRRVYYDYFRFRRQKAQREMLASLADSLQQDSAYRNIAAAALSRADTVVEVQREFTGYRPDTTGDTVE